MPESRTRPPKGGPEWICRSRKSGISIVSREELHGFSWICSGDVSNRIKMNTGIRRRSVFDKTGGRLPEVLRLWDEYLPNEAVFSRLRDYIGEIREIVSPNKAVSARFRDHKAQKRNETQRSCVDGNLYENPLSTVVVSAISLTKPINRGHQTKPFRLRIRKFKVLQATRKKNETNPNRPSAGPSGGDVPRGLLWRRMVVSCSIRHSSKDPRHDVEPTRPRPSQRVGLPWRRGVASG